MDLRLAVPIRKEKRVHYDLRTQSRLTQKLSVVVDKFNNEVT